MAASVTANLTEVSTADTASASGTWLGNSGAADTEVKIQGAGSYTWQASKNSRTSCTFTPSTNLDMSASGTHLYWWAQNAVAAFMEAKTTGTGTASGYTIRLADGSGNYTEWHIAGGDTWGGEWKCFIIDLSNTTQVYASSGTLDLSDIDVITWYVDISNSGNIRIIDNQWNDVVRFGTGLTVTGTTFDLVDVAADDEDSANKYGVLENIDGVVFCQGRLTIGDGTTTTTFQSTDEVLIFRDRVGTGDGIVSSSLYQLNLVGSGNTSTISGLVCKGAGSTDVTRPVIDVSDTSVSLTMSSSTFIHCGAVDFYTGQSITACAFTDCYQIDPSTATFQVNTITNYTGTPGSLLFPSDDTNISDLRFTNCDNGVEYGSSSDATSPGFDNFIFDDEAGNFDVNNTSGAAASINLTNGSNANSYNTGGDSVTFVSNPVTTTITVKDIDTGSVITGARVLVLVGDGTNFPYQDSVSLSGNGTTVTVTHTAHGLATGDYVLIEGATELDYNGVQQITVTGVDAYTYADTASGTAGGSPTATLALIEGTTNGSGIVSDTRSMSSDQLITGRVRYGASPYYKTAPIAGTVDSENGLSLTVQLIKDA